MLLLRLLLRNAFRHKLRTGLTILGFVVAVTAFGLLRTVVQAWYAGVEGSSSARLVVRSATSLAVPLPLAYAERLRGVDGVRAVTWSNWFGGLYREREFFPQFAVDPATYLALYPEYGVAEADRLAWARDRKGALVGRALADKYGWKVGDSVPLKSGIYPGDWSFVVRGIYEAGTPGADTGQMLIHWALLNETFRGRRGGADFVGVFILGIDDPGNAALIAARVDQGFANSPAETRTETERAFQLGFVAMSEAILLALQAVSGIVIVIILAVMANTMAMTARERVAEYATLKAIGFSPGFVALLIFAEGLLIAGTGGLLGMAATVPTVAALGRMVVSLFPAFHVSDSTLLWQAAASLGVGVVAAAWPAWMASRVPVAAGLRQIA